MPEDKLTPGQIRYKVYGREWYLKNKARRIKAASEWNQERKDLRNKRSRELYSKRYRIKKFAKQYKVTEDEMRYWLNITTCQLCGSDNKLTIDHCHKTGNIRGRLCTRCNTGVGMFCEDPVLMRQAALYIEGNIK